jgi:cellulose synthase operon protein C
LAMEMLLSPKMKKYKDAWSWYEKWESRGEQSGALDADAAAVNYLAGKAALELARSFNKDAANAELRTDYLRRAKELLTAAANAPGEYRKKARLLFNDPLLTAGQIRVETPKDFADACERARIAWDRLRETNLTPEEKDRLQAEASECFRFALDHAPADVKTDDLNAFRYCMAYLDWVAEDYYDAAVLGEFLARHDSNSENAQRGAEIAMMAYARLCGETTPGDDHKFEAAKMTAMADFITGKWPKSSVADAAWIMRIRAAMAKKETTKALDLLAKIAEESPRRADAELLTGQMLWSMYLDASRLPEEKQPTKDEMTNMISTARKLLETAVTRLRKAVEAGGAASPAAAAGSLALAQVYLQLGDGANAVKWIDDAKIGAHTLAKSADKAVAHGNFRADAFRVALWAYVATQQFDKVAEAMDAIEKIGSVNVAQIYASLGRQLEESFKRLRAAGDNDAAAKAARGFEFFLTRLAARPATETDFQTLYWVAETFMTLGDSVAGNAGKPSAQALAYYKKAAGVYEAILKACEADAKFAPKPGAILAIQVRLARCLRSQREYEKAMNALVEVLKNRENSLEVQREAAYTYQAWGEVEPGYYFLAIRGGHKAQDKTGVHNLVWGWAMLGRKVQNVKKFRDVFYEARFNLSLCFCKYAESKKGKEQTDFLRLAESSILVIQQIDPKMGGEKWYGQFDVLLRDIQRLLGKKENEQGLKAAEDAAASSATSKDVKK